VKCQRPVPALNMYAPSAQVLMADPKPRYVIGCLRALETWTRLRTCLRMLRHEAPEAEEGTWILAIAPPLHYHHYHCYCCVYSAPQHQAGPILGMRHYHSYTSVAPCALLQRVSKVRRRCRLGQTASCLQTHLLSTS